MKYKKLFILLLALIMMFSMAVPTFAAENSSYSDVAIGSWYADAVVYVNDNDIMSGTTATTFAPNATMTRAMLATVLYRAASSPSVANSSEFSDVAAGQWYTQAVTWAAENDIIGGYGNGLFGTNDPVTREQIATILWRYEDSPATVTTEAFADDGAISTWAAEAVDWARSNGIINGKSGNLFDPKVSATRAEVAVMLRNYLSPNSPDTPSNENRILVVYFSQPETADPNNMTTEEANSTVVIDGEVLGNTQYMAYVIQENTGANIFRIEPQTPYPLNHDTLVEQAQEEQNQKFRPAIKNRVENLDTYDTIFLGYPNWWGDMPMILYSFLEEYDLSGKTVIPFNTHGGSGFSDTISTISQLQPNAIVLQGGLSISRNNIQEAEPNILSWLNGLDVLD